ncbi:MAG: hypothetical protein A3K19_30235 [Lentisphaerae bacterium RIFOXYB12_FULL_65_16]|nr:MAG: hypothetical protein A3K18_18720 [Lentisphaerae bacterium RIFOXYA12_64_32]OGV85859.1 MAG: hypothetical protein A3K19_30235 [Lentisphaerae bacterium RIFOXYB12_FULL_65_16]
MTPIRALLSRIQWDREFGAATFEIGWYDRVADRIVRSLLPERSAVPASHEAVDTAAPDPHETGNRARLCLTDESGIAARIPLHRIREVYRNGELIWQRPMPGKTD